jgi:hypothetical protein
MVFLFPSRRKLDERVESDYPKSALQYVASHPVGGQWFNDYGWGGYLIWSGSPKNMIFIDGRADIYEYGGVLSDYLTIARLKPDAFKLLERYGVEACLIRRQDPLATALDAMPGWERAYEDPMAAIYIHKPAAGGR